MVRPAGSRAGEGEETGFAPDPDDDHLRLALSARASKDGPAAGKSAVAAKNRHEVSIGQSTFGWPML